MKSMFQMMAAGVCALALTACGGGNKAASTPVAAQPDYQQTDVVSGTGLTAASGDLIVVNATGWLYDASKKDSGGKGDKLPTTVVSNYNININSGMSETFTQGVGAVIAGRDQGTAGMKVGGTRRLVIPAALAFGHNGLAYTDANSKVVTVIAADAALVYDIELLSVVKASKPPVLRDPPTILESSDDVVGTGPAAANGSAVTANYTLWLFDGSRSDSKGVQVQTSAGTPFAFTVGAGSVIKGWDQGIVGMKQGGTRTLIIPPSLGYGADGQSPSIPGNASLVFVVNLVSVK